MRNELELLELVDRYLDGDLDATERAAFEQRLGTEPELNALLADQRGLREGLERLVLRPAVAKAYHAHRFGKWNPWLGGAGAVVIAVVSATLWMQRPVEVREQDAMPKVKDTVRLQADTVTLEGTITSVHMDTITDTVYKVFQNGKWPTVKERPEGAQVTSDDQGSAPSTEGSTQSLATEDPTTALAQRAILPVRMAPVEKQPEFPGGMSAFYSYLETNIKHPDLASAVSGTVVVGFTIDAQGAVSNAEIVSGIDATYNAEALRVIRSMPTWKPAEQNGKPVPSRLQMPMQFRNPGGRVEDAAPIR